MPHFCQKSDPFCIKFDQFCMKYGYFGLKVGYFCLVFWLKFGHIWLNCGYFRQKLDKFQLKLWSFWAWNAQIRGKIIFCGQDQIIGFVIFSPAFFRISSSIPPQFVWSAPWRHFCAWFLPLFPRASFGPVGSLCFCRPFLKTWPFSWSLIDYRNLCTFTECP